MSLREWANVFRDELRAFEVLRDTLRTHPERLADEEVRAGIQLTQSLLDGARRFVLQANAPAQREGLEAIVRQWLSEGGWKLVEHRGSGADIVAERAEERLVVEVKAGRSGLRNVDALIGQLLRLLRTEDASAVALAVPTDAVPSVLRIPLDIREQLSMRLLEVTSTGEVREHLLP
jgi:hypothetical protein